MIAPMKKLVTKYIKNVEHALETVRLPKDSRSLRRDKIEAVVELAKSYMKDARFYLDKGKLETALSSITYCEGLLDALRLLGAAELRWLKTDK